jgi:alpha/beta superfamily hydrolase
MPEQRIRISSGPHELEAAWESGLEPEGVVLCHPHPLYGGTMDNNVVMAVRRSLASLGWTTVRFNFRGVGSSGGNYGEGQGEVEDLLSAAAHLEEQGVSRIHVAGYSFGAWIALRALKQSLEPAALFLISPPMQFLDFSNLTLPASPTLITLGDADGFCSVSTLKSWLTKQTHNPDGVHLEILEGCDHFYWGYETALGSILEGFINSMPASSHRSASGRSDPPDH